jgi:predicted glycoside hydrolase/deacetylase ChbG (UPF0249 family)
MKRLLVNADDFGLTSGVNRAIVACHERGIVTSTTLMATGAAFDEAVALASSLPRLSVGCHVVLVDGEPLLPPDEVRSLLAPGTNRFYNTIGEILQAVVRGRFRPEEVEAEASAQMTKLRAAGVCISHFDAHKHTHMFPSILRPVLRAAVTNGVHAVRNPFEPSGSMKPGTVLASRKLFVRWAEVSMLRSLRSRFMRLVRENGLQTTDGSLGVAVTGELGTAVLGEMMQRMDDGCWELVCHPGYNDAELASVRTRLRESREIEMQTLMDVRLRTIAQRCGIEFVSYAELTSAQPVC